ncbi:hypothetical protein BM1_10946 [Bipolaris maydis]|nr:hypothetical protein BM1_10946 [Bipolaris maydis]
MHRNGYESISSALKPANPGSGTVAEALRSDNRRGCQTTPTAGRIIKASHTTIKITSRSSKI